MDIDKRRCGYCEDSVNIVTRRCGYRYKYETVWILIGDSVDIVKRRCGYGKDNVVILNIVKRRCRYRQDSLYIVKTVWI